MDTHPSFIWIIISFDKAFEYGDDAKCLSYAVVYGKPLCVELCNFVQCHSFVNHLTC
jgi:hypothetical protein